jgi:hypothetical protein
MWGWLRAIQGPGNTFDHFSRLKGLFSQCSRELIAINQTLVSIRPFPDRIAALESPQAEYGLFTLGQSERQYHHKQPQRGSHASYFSQYQGYPVCCQRGVEP